MNTINTRSTPEAILSAEDRQTLRAAWQERASAKRLTAADCLLYALLRGKDPLRAFTPITRPTKLANGHSAWQGLSAAVSELRWRLPAWLPATLLEGKDLHALVKSQLANLRKEG